jgi:hypothetical protein
MMNIATYYAYLGAQLDGAIEDGWDEGVVSTYEDLDCCLELVDWTRQDGCTYAHIGERLGICPEDAEARGRDGSGARMLECLAQRSEDPRARDLVLAIDERRRELAVTRRRALPH